MSGLRIMFEVDEKHVGACLVALEGRARNLNFEVIAEGDWQSNAKGVARATSGHQKLTPEFVLQQLKEYHPQGVSKGVLNLRVKGAKYKVQGLNSIMLSLVKKKLVKKVGKGQKQVYVLVNP